MPRTGFQTSSNLIIQLDSNSFVFKPGDTISGTLKHVKLPTDPDFLIRSVKLIFWGRAKTKLIRSNGNGKSVYRGRAMLLNDEPTLTRVESMSLEDGTSAAWNFSFIMPGSPSASSLAADAWGAEYQFESVKEDIAKHKLPPIFYYKGKSGLSSTEKEAYIEYVLSASIDLCRSDKTSTVTTKSTTVPLMIRYAGTERSIESFGLQERSSHVLVKTLRLKPDKSDTSLTFREQMRSTFRPSKIPQFDFQFVVSHPTKIQLSNPRVPFKIQMRPIMEPDRTTIPPADYPSIRITSFMLCIESHTFLRCESTFGTTSSDKSDEVVICGGSIRPNRADEFDFILSPDSGESFDLGWHLQIAVHRDRATVLGVPVSPFRKHLYPTFKTYNVAQTHELIWKLQIEILGTGKIESIEGRGPTVILSESEQYLMANEERTFDGKGVKKNHDDASAYAEQGLNLVSQVLQAVAG